MFNAWKSDVEILLVKFAHVTYCEVINDKYSYKPIQSKWTKGLLQTASILTLPNVMHAIEGKGITQM